MADDPIRSLLAAHVKTSFAPRVEPGMRVIYREHVEGAGGDRQLIERWVADHGGYLGQLPDRRERSLGPNYGRVHPGAVFYAVPADALGL